MLVWDILFMLYVIKRHKLLYVGAQSFTSPGLVSTRPHSHRAGDCSRACQQLPAPPPLPALLYHTLMFLSASCSKQNLWNINPNMIFIPFQDICYWSNKHWPEPLPKIKKLIHFQTICNIANSFAFIPAPYSSWVSNTRQVAVSVPLLPRAVPAILHPVLVSAITLQKSPCRPIKMFATFCDSIRYLKRLQRLQMSLIIF